MKVHLALLLLCGGYHDVVEASSRSIDSAYDTNKGVFSPQGKLVQLDYIEVRAISAKPEVSCALARSFRGKT